MIFGTQPAFRAPGQPWQTFSGAPGGLKRPAGSKLREQNCGPIGNQGFQMLNFCFASRCSKSLRALVTVRPNPSKAWTPGSPETPLPAYDEQFVNFVVVFCPPFSISISRRCARNPLGKRAPPPFAPHGLEENRHVAPHCFARYCFRAMDRRSPRNGSQPP